ncbi:MAG: hypothetical protein Q8J85_13600 [Sulfuricurvum sp.]|nr:hypothetical protein [Sulfuricurvum sp.]MDP3021955.1 hypothetical protein [Sulfuricurvum sp.]
MKKSLIFLLVLATGITLYSSDVILSNTLGAYYCAQEPNPKTYIKHTVEEPISIYWEDNIYPGFDDRDAELMVKNYLDGVHLQMMALNAPDGKVRVYSYTNVPQSYVDLVKEGYEAKKDWQKKNQIHQEAFKKMYDKSSHKIRDEFAEEWKVISTQSGDAFRKDQTLTKQIEAEKSQLDLVITETTKQQMFQTNYTVKTEEVHLSDLAQKVIYSDEVKITDNRSKEVVAYNRRIMQLYSATLMPDLAIGNRYYYPEPMCGEVGYMEIDRKVFLVPGFAGMKHLQFDENRLYQKYVKKATK